MLQLTIGDADKGMSGFELVASLADHLAWPAAICLLVFFFHKEIPVLLGRIKEVSHGDTRIDFHGGIDKAEKAMDAAEAAPPHTPDPEKALSEAAPVAAVLAGSSGKGATAVKATSAPQVVDAAGMPAILAAVDQVTQAPAVAVTSAWDYLSTVVEKLAVKHGLGATQPYLGRTFATARKLNNKNIFDTQIMVLLAQLRKTRNAAANGEAVDADGALRYIRLVSRFLKLIEPL